ncbi:hypothetical protein THAOC_26256, partial [Thalassiosira oceanica]
MRHDAVTIYLRADRSRPARRGVGCVVSCVVFPIVAGAFGEVNEDASKLVTNLARLTAKTDFGKSSHRYSQPQQERRCLPNHAVTVPTRPRLPNSQGAGTTPPQTEALCTPDPPHGRHTKQRKTIILNIDPDQKSQHVWLCSVVAELYPRGIWSVPTGRSILWTTDALRFGLAHPITSSYNSACNQAGALGPIAGRPFTPLKVTDDGAGEDNTGSTTTGTYDIWCLELHFAGGGTALRNQGDLFLGFLEDSRGILLARWPRGA